MKYAKIEEAIASIARGDMVLVVDDEDRENEGDLIVAAEKVTSEHIAFMVRHTSGLICLPMNGRAVPPSGSRVPTALPAWRSTRPSGAYGSSGGPCAARRPCAGRSSVRGRE